MKLNILNIIFFKIKNDASIKLVVFNSVDLTKILKFLNKIINLIFLVLTLLNLNPYILVTLEY